MSAFTPITPTSLKDIRVHRALARDVQLQKAQQDTQESRSDTIDKASSKTEWGDDPRTEKGDDHPLPEIVLHRSFQQRVNPLGTLGRVDLVVYHSSVNVVHSMELA